MVNTPTANATDVAINFALAQVGKPYVWGAEGPNAYDCSGLVWRSYKEAGISLPRVTGLLIAVGTEVRKENLQPGDLVFPDPGHVQIYLGGGKVVEAPEAGKNVRVVNMWGFWRARRVNAPGTQRASAGDIIGGGINGGIGDKLGLPGQTVGSAVDASKSVFDLLTKLTDPHMWLRIGTFMVGAALLVFALIRLN